MSGQFTALLPEIESLLMLCAFDVLKWAKDRAPGMVMEKEKQFRNFLDRFEPA